MIKLEKSPGCDNPGCFAWFGAVAGFISSESFVILYRYFFNSPDSFISQNEPLIVLGSMVVCGAIVLYNFRPVETPGE